MCGPVGGVASFWVSGIHISTDRQRRTWSTFPAATPEYASSVSRACPIQYRANLSLSAKIFLGGTLARRAHAGHLL